METYTKRACVRGLRRYHKQLGEAINEYQRNGFSSAVLASLVAVAAGVSRWKQRAFSAWWTSNKEG